MTHRFLITLLLLAACGSSAPPATAPTATPAPAAPTAPAAGANPHADHIAQFDAFLADPTRVDGAPLMKFVAESPAVSVDVDVAFVSSLFGPTLDERAQGLLLLGFIAGSARAQLIANIKQHDNVAAMRGLLQVYANLQASIPILDEAAAADRAGTLDVWVANRQKKPTSH